MTLYTILYEDGHCEYPALIIPNTMTHDQVVAFVHAEAVQLRPKVGITRIMRRSDNTIIWGTK